VTIRSADPNQANEASYSLDVTREGCTVERPLYSPVSSTCTVACPSGFYPNYASQRCSKCNTHCAVCESLSRCELCSTDTVRHRYILQPGGSCAQLLVAVEDKYRWWCVGLVIFVGLLLCLGLAMLCECMCRWCRCGCFAVPYNGSYDSDSEGEFAYKS